MASRDLDINARIANLTQLQDQLKSLSVNVKLNNGELTKLLKIGESGLTIKVNLDFGNKLQKLLDLAEKGINIRVNSPQGSGGGGRGGSRLSDFDQYKELEQERLEKAFSSSRSERVANTDRQLRARFEEQARQAAIAAKVNDSTFYNSPAGPSTSLFDRFNVNQERLRLRNEAEERRYARANKELEQGGVFGFGNRRENFIDRGLSSERLIDKPSLFNLNRLKEPSTAEAVLFSGLLGGPANAIGGALGGATIGGPTGVLLGTSVIDLAKRAFEQLGETLLKASEAGVEFERSIAGLTGIVGASTDVVKGGNKVEGVEAYLANKSLATGLATSARRALIPLGIAGETEASLANAFITSRSAQGFLPSEGTTKTVLERLGAFIQTSGSDINPTRIFKDITDIFTGAPQAKSTALGARLKNITPELFSGKTLTDEELVKATSTLQQYVDALKNGNDFLQQRIRVEGELSNLQLSLGEGLNRGLVPGIKSLAEALDNPTLEKNLNLLGQKIGELGSKAIQTGLDAEATASSAGENLGGLAAFASILNPTGQGNTFANYLIDQGTFGNKGQDLTNEGQLSKLNERRSIKGLGSLNIDENGVAKAGPTHPPNSEAIFKQFLTQVGLTDKDIDDATTTTTKNNPYFRLASSLQGQVLGKSFEKQNFFAKEQVASLGDIANSQAAGVDQSTIEGQIKALDIKRSALPGQLNALQFEKTSKNIELSGVEAGPVGDKKRLQLVNDIKLIEDQIAAKQAEGPKFARERLALTDKLLDQEKRGLNTTTFSGDIATSAATIKANNQKIANRSALTDAESEAEKREFAIQNKVEAFNIKRAEIGRVLGGDDKQAREFVGLRDNVINQSLRGLDTRSSLGERNALQVDIAANAQKLANRQGVGGVETEAERRELALKTSVDQQNIAKSILGDATNKAQFGIDFSRLQKAFADLADKGKDLADAFTNSKKALSDFNDETKLRSLGRQGQLLSLADKIQGAANSAEESGGGPTIASLPFGVDQGLVKGSQFFDPVRRARFELESAEEEGRVTSNKLNPFRVREEEEQQRGKLGRNIGSIGREIGDLGNQDKELRLGFFAKSVENAQRFAGTPFGKQLKASLQQQLPQLKQVGVELGQDFKLDDLLGGSADAQKLQGGTTEERTKILTRNLNRFGADQSKVKGIGGAIQNQKEKEETFKKEIASATKELAEDKRTLNQLTKADITDAVNVGSTLALSSHFN